jgi:hypothetical protein
MAALRNGSKEDLIVSLLISAIIPVDIFKEIIDILNIFKTI